MLSWVNSQDASQVPANVPQIDLQTTRELAEGAFSITVDRSAGLHITIAGGPFSGVIYGVEELLQRQTRTRSDAVEVIATDLAMSPALPYSTFWTWDHSTNWELGQIGHQEIGVFNPYGKPPSGFLRDYKRVVDFCSSHRIAAVVIYGFLRDSHGGIAAAQELCRYATERGVRILPGVAIGAYGGVYWEGDHKYNLSHWLDLNPELASDMERGVGFQLKDLAFPLNFPRSDYTRHSCPSRRENMDWMEDAISWLVETFDVGGVNLEAGDYGVCGCDLCQKRRGDREKSSRRAADAEFWSHVDMADNFPRLYDAARSRRDDLWVYCELQWDNLLDPIAHEPLGSMPEGAIYQHTVNKSYWEQHKTRLTEYDISSLPTAKNVLRSQFACQWNGDERTQRYNFNAPVFAEMAKTCADIGLQGLTVWGEPSPYHVSAEFSYLAFGRFTYEPGLDWQQFTAEEIDPRVGGKDAGSIFLGYMEELDASDIIDINRLTSIRRDSLDHACQLDGDASGRWIWLADKANQRISMGI